MVKAGGSRKTLLPLYYIWRAFPYPLRRLVTALFIMDVLLMKKLFRVDGQNTLHSTDELGTLSFWGVPQVDLATHRLQVDGEVATPLSLSYGELSAMASEKRQVRMHCVGGFRNNSVMEGVPLSDLLKRAGVNPRASRAVFHCADGYYTAIALSDLKERGALLAYRVNGEEIRRFGYPLRLAIPGKYGYKWAKWLVRIELVVDERRGYWESLGLPDTADVGDVW